MENNQELFIPLSDEESGLDIALSFNEWIRAHTQPYRELMSFYNCAMMEVETKFRVLNEDLSLRYDRNPIESIQTRLKSSESIINKIIRRGYPLSIDGIAENFNDIAGIRVICSFQSDIYKLAKAFLDQDDVTLIAKKDYIQHPKPNGYRSLHLIVSIPIFLHNEKKSMRAEVQLRTLAMDLWASAEHKIRYKKENCLTETDNRTLLECAETCASIDQKLEEIYQHAKANSANEEE